MLARIKCVLMSVPVHSTSIALGVELSRELEVREEQERNQKVVAGRRLLEQVMKDNNAQGKLDSFLLWHMSSCSWRLLDSACQAAKEAGRDRRGPAHR